MSEWETTPLHELATVFDGPHATPTKTSDGPWYLSISSLCNGWLDLSQSAHLSILDFPKWTRRVAPAKGDTLFSYETRLGEAAHWRTDLPAALGRRMGLLRPKRERVDPRFLTYAYLGPQFQEVIRAETVHGATVDRLPIADMPRWPLAVPPLEEQRRVAGVLGAFDDLIDINRQLMDTLGTQIATMFGGLATEEVREFFDVFEVDFGGAFKGEYFAQPGTGLPLLRIRDLKTQRCGTWTTERLPGDSLVTAGDVLVGMDAEFRPTQWLGDPSLLNQRVARIRAKGRSLAWTREALIQPMAYVEGYKTGTTVAHLNKRDMAGLQVRVPSERDGAVFDAAAQPLFDAITSIAGEIADLTRARDELLPLLMSGRVQVRKVA